MPEQELTVAEQAIARAAQVFHRAYREAEAAIEAIEDPQEALARANDLFNELQGIYTQASELRTQTVGRIWEAEELSIAKMADWMGMTRQRASQIVAVYRDSKEEPCPSP